MCVYSQRNTAKTPEMSINTLYLLLDAIDTWAVGVQSVRQLLMTVPRYAIDKGGFSFSVPMLRLTLIR